MKVGELEYAKRKAVQLFEELNDVTGFPDKHTGYYYELISIVEDAVDIGARVACGETIDLKKYKDT